MTDSGCPALPARAPEAFGAFPFGFGVFPLCGEARPSEDDAVRVVLAALDTGVRFIDTADSYQLRRQSAPSPQSAPVAGSAEADTRVARPLVHHNCTWHVLDDASKL